MFDRLRAFAVGERAGQGKSTYLGLRSLVFTVDPSTITFRPDAQVHGAWCGVADFAVDRDVATLVVIADGTVSLYTSTGGGVLGAGEHEAVWAAARRFLDVASDAVPFLRRGEDVPPTPDPGHVRLSVRTFDGTVSQAVAEEVAQRGRHELAPLYAAAQDVLTEVRLATAEREE